MPYTDTEDARLANQMKEECHNTAISQRQGPRALTLTLELSNTHWQLSLARANTAPIKTEIGIFATAFNVPRQTKITREKVEIPDSDKAIHVARLRWPREQPALLKET